MKKGEKLEKLTEEYFRQILKPYDLEVEKIGGSDSTNTDIHINKSGKTICRIECKESPSQSSQFVVYADQENGTYRLSKKNKSHPTEASNLIVEHMNANSNYYATVSLKNKAVDLICSEDLMYEHISADLSNKSDFIITATKSGTALLEDSLERDTHWTNGLLLKPSQIKEIFDVSGKYRIKRSGTRNATKKHTEDFPLEVIEIDGTLYVHDSENLHEANQPGGLYLPPSDENGRRKIKKKSETHNANIIFSLKIKESIIPSLDTSGFHDFIKIKIRD